MSDNTKRLQKLGGSDFEIADGEPDIRGWDVKDSFGKQLGEVEELIFDTQSRKVRYLVVDLEENDYDLDDKEVLVPVGVAELHGDDDDVILNGVTAEQLSSLPEYDDDRLDGDYESSIRNVLGGSALGGAAAMGASGTGTDFYQHEHFNEANLYRNRPRFNEASSDSTIPVVGEELEVGKREVETGGMRLRSRIVENEVSEDVNLRHETVQVERNNVDRPATGGDFQEEELEMRAHDEVHVVNKSARVVEEISLNKVVTEHEETIHENLKSTEVSMNDDNNSDLNMDDDIRDTGGRDTERRKDGGFL